jgi:hypothetical protein
MSNQIKELQQTIIAIESELDMAGRCIKDAQSELSNLEDQVNSLRNELTQAMIRELSEEIITAIECRDVRDLIVVDAEVVVHTVELTFEWGNLKHSLNASIESVIRNYFNYAIKENKTLKSVADDTENN